MARKQQVEVQQPSAEVVVLHDAHVQAMQSQPTQAETSAQESTVPTVDAPKQESETKPAVDMKHLKMLGRELAAQIGGTEATIHSLQQSTQANVERVLTDMINAGFTMEMWGKGKAVWEEISNEIQIAWGMHKNEHYKNYVIATRAADHIPALFATWAIDNGVQEATIPDSTLNNRRNAIKTFLMAKIKGEPTASLDLYNNADRKARAENAKKQVHHVTKDKTDEPKKDEQPQDSAEGTGKTEPNAELKTSNTKTVNVSGRQNMVNAALLVVIQNQGCNLADRKYLEAFENIVRMAVADGLVAMPECMKAKK